MKKRGKSKKSQITVFVIIALIIIASIVGYLALKGKIFTTGIPARFQPVETYFISCLNDKTSEGIRILGDRGGYIYLPKFEPGSSYRPFSSQLDFFSMAIPYWYYVSGNNIISEQKPTKKQMQEQLKKYIEENINDCSFDDFISQGFLIDVNLDELDARVIINENNVDVSLSMPISMKFGDESASIESHDAKIESKLGKFYDIATRIYDYEKQNMFIENYAVDVLRLYAPVDGVEISCSPKTWLQSDIETELKSALESNMQAIKLNGNYYELKNEENKYFVQNIESDEAVNFLYSQDFPFRMEVWESNNGVMLAEPVGLEQGLGILGFCYVPYHFVYDINYPVLVQVYDEDEIFQFPFAVIIDKNKPREALPVSSSLGDVEPEICKYKNTEVSVYSYNKELEPIEADVSFACAGGTCDIGKTEIKGNEAKFAGNFPQCVNGVLVARAEGYADKKQIVSTNIETSVDVILERLYNISLELRVDGKITNNLAIVSFSSESSSATIAWPEQKKVKLAEGYYNISVYVYRNSSIIIPAVNKKQCSEVPKSGVLGIMGMTEEKCFDINLPEQKISNSLAGGGKSSEYIFEQNLQNGKMIIDVNSIKVPTSLEQLQDAYNLIEIKDVNLEFQ